MTTVRTLGPALLVRGLMADRGRPDLDALARETDPERFVWRILPHAARSFAASIVVLRPDQARAAAVGYLYCRMLDTYEDLIEEPAESIALLEAFAGRLESDRLPPPPPVDPDLARDDRDRVYLLLLERCDRVDAVFRTLPAESRDRIRLLVRSMADGMAWSKDAFERQGGILLDRDQLARYCHSVIGYPVLFILDLVGRREVTQGAREDALLVSEMIQLANVTRDIERDLARGVGYHPALKPYLGRPAGQPESREVVREVREELLEMALGRAPAYRRLFNGLDLGGTAAVRAAAVLMLLFTDLHYRSCARRTGNPSWPGPRSRFQVVAGSIPALMSPRFTGRILRRVENDFVTAAARLAGKGRRPAAAAALG